MKIIIILLSVLLFALHNFTVSQKSIKKFLPPCNVNSSNCPNCIKNYTDKCGKVDTFLSRSFNLRLSKFSDYKSTSKISPTVIGGEFATEGQFLWAGAIFLDNGDSLCGCSILSPNFVVTAGHCCKWFSQFTFYFGSTNITVSNSRIVAHVNSTSNVYIHGLYNETNLRNDICLIKVNLPQSYFTTGKLMILRLPSLSHAKNETFAGQIAISAGWGITSETESSPSIRLKYARLLVLRNSECLTYYGSDYVFPTTICTAFNTSGNICSGDSGGGLFLQEEDRNYTIIGVVSFNVHGFCAKNPAGFTRVSSYLPWLQHFTNISVRP